MASEAHYDGRPTPQELIECFLDPESHSPARAFLEANPSFKDQLERVCQLEEVAAQKVRERAKPRRFQRADGKRDLIGEISRTRTGK